MKRVRTHLKIPKKFQFIQVNHCKSSICKNFLISATTIPDNKKDIYSTSGGKSSNAVIKCNECGKYSTIKSNQGIHEEYERIKLLHNPVETISCLNVKCSNYQIDPINRKKYFHSYGKTKAGSKRYKCKSCGKLASIPQKSTLRQRRKDINSLVFRLLVNKMPMRRICETVDIHPGTLYSKIDFIYKQCKKFATHHENNFFGNNDLDRLYLSTDRQEYVFNWGSQLDRRNVKLHAIGTADNKTGYVFGMHLDFDPTINSEEIEKQALQLKDYEVAAQNRRFARLWLQGDYSDKFIQSPIKDKPSVNSGTDDPTFVDDDYKRPSTGVQIRAEYTQFGHFYYLAYLFKNVKKIRFYLDREPGINAAVCSAFKERIVNNQVDAFYVKINKDLSVDKKKLFKAQGVKAIREFIEVNGEFTDYEAEVMLLSQLISETGRNALSSSWITHPVPDMGEPQKAIQWITTNDNYSIEHIAKLYRIAKLKGIDRFFMLVRRRMSVFERPIVSSSNKKSWHGYSAYNPAIGIKLLEIMRVFYNFSLPRKDKKSPASRLGICDEASTLEEILNFMND